MDGTWGFVLLSGQNYTAPVFVGEFGASQRGDFWLKMLRYLSVTDVDWAYWPLNPTKVINAEFKNHQWHDIDPPRKVEDGWSILARDWMSIRNAWAMDDLQHIMASPSGWVPESYPCNRDLLYNECGG